MITRPLPLSLVIAPALATLVLTIVPVLAVAPAEAKTHAPVDASRAPISCALAKTLARAKVRPVWFPSPQPAGRLEVNAYVPLFGPGLEWSPGPRYVFLGRVPDGANLGAPFPTEIADRYLANFHSRLKVWRLAKVEGRRLYAEWRTLAGNRVDLSYAASRNETVMQFIRFLSSLRPIVWPTCRR